MGRNPTGTRQYTIQRVWERHHEIKRLLLLGLSNKVIAKRLGVTPQNISDVRNSPIFQEQLAVLEAARDAESVDISKVLLEDAPKSIKLLHDVRDGKLDATLQLKVSVAQDLLNRVPQTAKVTNVRGEIAHGIFTPEDINQMKERANEAKQRARVFQAEQVPVEIITNNTKENVA